MLFLNKGNLTTSVYRKPTFSGADTYFDSFLPDTYEIDLVYTLLKRCFRICSNWSIDNFKENI